jgi:hypothetical protein
MRGENLGRVAAPVAAIAAAIFAFGVGLNMAQAEDAKPADATKPATTTPPAATTPPKAADTKPATTTPATPKTTDTKAAATPSPCKGLDETACKANAECSWYKEAKLKDGKTRKAHCQKKPTPKKKKTEPKTETK